MRDGCGWDKVTDEPCNENPEITYTDENGNQVTTTSSSTRRALEKQLDQSNERQSNLNTKINE